MNNQEFVILGDEELESAAGGRRIGRVNVYNVGGYPGYAGGYSGYGGYGYGAAIPAVSPYAAYPAAGYGYGYGAYAPAPSPYGYGAYPGGYGMRLGTAI